MWVFDFVQEIIHNTGPGDVESMFVKGGDSKVHFVKGRASDRRSNGREPRPCSVLALLKR